METCTIHYRKAKKTTINILPKGGSPETRHGHLSLPRSCLGSKANLIGLVHYNFMSSSHMIAELNVSTRNMTPPRIGFPRPDHYLYALVCACMRSMRLHALYALVCASPKTKYTSKNRYYRVVSCSGIKEPERPPQNKNIATTEGET